MSSLTDTLSVTFWASLGVHPNGQNRTHPCPTLKVARCIITLDQTPRGAGLGPRSRLWPVWVGVWGIILALGWGDMGLQKCDPENSRSGLVATQSALCGHSQCRPTLRCSFPEAGIKHRRFNLVDKEMAT